jgi:hypothetical protein
MESRTVVEVGKAAMSFPSANDGAVDGACAPFYGAGSMFAA